MRKSRRPIVIASRRSPLARIQATAVGNALGRLHPQVRVEYRWMESEADQAPHASLSTLGGKGLFARTIEQALLKGDADLAVHSLKDLPAVPSAESAGLTIAAVPARADVRDGLIARSPEVTTLAQLPQGATMGTASPRRTAQLLRLRPDLQIELIRGNVETRLAKVKEDDRFQATLLALAGLGRLGLKKKSGVQPLSLEEMLPAAGQGALALQCRADDHVTISRCLPLNDPIASAAVHAERAIVASLQGDCHSPIAVLVRQIENKADIRVRVLARDGSQCIELQEQAPFRSLDKLTKQVIAQLDAQGARPLLHADMPGYGGRQLSRT